MRKLVLLSFLFGMITAQAQYSQKTLGKERQVYRDSLMQLEYHYLFPIWGQGAYKKGFDLPNPAGIMINYFSLEQKMLIDNIMLGVNGNGLHDFSGLITFSDITATGRNVSLRPDLWILPFLNVYGIFGMTQTKTSVILSSPIPLQAAGQGSGSTIGFGVTGAGGVGPLWFAVDYNQTWSNMDILHDPAIVGNLSFRVGHTFVNPLKPYRNVSIWLGAFGSELNTETNGSISLSDALEDVNLEDLDGSKYQEWKDGLNPGQKFVVEKIEETIRDKINGDPNADLIIDYSLDKQLMSKWNMLAGFQYQFNKSLIFRTEAGFFGSRSQALFSLNYRFKI